ncbi:MarP family serine protease [Microbacterium sp. 2FI]|uniref:MarP family serine protease n=1 Tax=Microbacterium sp. 2FI TaxID=2502193 RepID=UPI0010F55C95|nr:MarP family serine protease [Microbacterium sp. 2FI]
MLIVDIVLVLVLIGALVAGATRGFVGSIGVIAGLVAGGAAAYWLVPLVNDAWPWQQWRPLVVVLATLGLLIGGASIGGAVGSALRRGVDRTPLRVFDRLLGAGVGVVAAALALSLAGASLAATGMPIVSSAVSSSTVLRTIERLTPAPVSRGLAELRTLVLDEGIPALGDLLEIGEVPSVPPVDLDDPELTQAAASVARVSGTAYSCGTSSTGSGFVVAPDRIVTNAHVVAGVDQPVVELPGRAAREGRIVYFDPVDDLAVVAVDGLDAVPLPLVPTVPAGTAAAVQGFPLGGPFTMISAGVLSVGTVPVPNIYDDGLAPREIYALQAAVRPGNSGGPLLTDDGAVAGVVFARAENDAERGYAMTMAELDPVAAQAASLSDQVSSGRCIG